MKIVHEFLQCRDCCLPDETFRVAVRIGRLVSGFALAKQPGSHLVPGRQAIGCLGCNGGRSDQKTGNSQWLGAVEWRT